MILSSIYQKADYCDTSLGNVRLPLPRRGEFFRFLQISAFEETFHKGEQPLSQNNLKQMNRK